MVFPSTIDIAEFQRFCDHLSMLYYHSKHEEFVTYMYNAPANLLDLLLHLNSRQSSCELVDISKEIMSWFMHIYELERYEVDDKGLVYVNFTLRNIYDVILFNMFIHNLLYAYVLNYKAFCKLFEGLPFCLYNKIDFLREASFKTRDSDIYKSLLRKAKFISFSYFGEQ